MHAFSWTGAGGMVDLGTLGGMSRADGVNQTGEVVGWPATGYVHRLGVQLDQRRGHGKSGQAR